jgi:hypothetical protein
VKYVLLFGETEQFAKDLEAMDDNPRRASITTSSPYHRSVAVVHQQLIRRVLTSDLRDAPHRW